MGDVNSLIFRLGFGKIEICLIQTSELIGFRLVSIEIIAKRKSSLLAFFWGCFVNFQTYGDTHKIYLNFTKQ